MITNNIIKNDSYQQFKRDLAKYTPYEDVLATKLIKYYNLTDTKYQKCNNNSYDIRLSNNQTYELKCDVTGQKTGNVFVEHYSRGKPSGILTTKADYYVFSFDLIKYYVIPSIKLKKLITSNCFKIKHIRSSNTYGHLIPMDIYIENCSFVL
jgi:hypothetical protein